MAEPDPRYIPPVPFPQRLAKTKANEGFKSFLHMLKQLHITIPFTDAIMQIPSYAKFLKDIISNKRPLEELHTVKLTEQCSAVLNNEMPAKMDDPGKYTIPCTIGKATIKKALCDMRASVSLMPRTVFEKIGVGDLKSTHMTLQLADGLVCLPLGMIEDVPVQVGKFYVPGDFVVMEMEEDKEVLIILGRPFLRTAGALMDVKDGKLILRIGGETIEFSIDKAMRYPNQLGSCCMVEEMDIPIEKTLRENYEEALNSYQHSVLKMQEAIGVEESLVGTSINSDNEPGNLCGPDPVIAGCTGPTLEVKTIEIEQECKLTRSCADRTGSHAGRTDPMTLLKPLLWYVDLGKYGAGGVLPPDRALQQRATWLHDRDRNCASHEELFSWNPCYWPIGIAYKAYWAIRALNMGMKENG